MNAVPTVHHVGSKQLVMVYEPLATCLEDAGMHRHAEPCETDPSPSLEQDLGSCVSGDAVCVASYTV